jgi:hypothetical protein
LPALIAPIFERFLVIALFIQGRNQRGRMMTKRHLRARQAAIAAVAPLWQFETPLPSPNDAGDDDGHDGVDRWLGEDDAEKDGKDSASRS